MDYTDSRVDARTPERARVQFETVESVHPSSEATSSRPTRKPRSQIAKAIASREQTPATPATDNGMVSGAETLTTPKRRRSRAGTPKPPPTPGSRVSKRQRNLEPSNQGIPMNTAPTPKRAKKDTMPQARRAPSPAIKMEETTPSPDPMRYPVFDAASPVLKTEEAIPSHDSVNYIDLEESIPAHDSTNYIELEGAIPSHDLTNHIASNAAIPSWITLACTALGLPSTVDEVAQILLERFQRCLTYPIRRNEVLAVVGACIVVACGDLGLVVLYDKIAQTVGCDKAEMAIASGSVYSEAREDWMGELMTPELRTRLQNRSV